MKTQIEQEYELRARQLTRMREEFSARVVRWVYSKAEIWSSVDRRRKGTDDDILPSDEGALYACGFDAADQPIINKMFGYELDRRGQKVPTKQVWSEEFVRHNNDEIEVTCFVHETLRQLFRRKFVGHRILEEESVMEGYYRRTLFLYEGTKTKLTQSFNNKGQLFQETVFGPHGQQSYFRVRRDGPRFQLYQPLPKGVSIKSLNAKVKERLLALVPEVVAAARIEEPIYCVALVYDDEGNDALPPSIGVGTESERAGWKSEHGKRAKEYVWNPAEFRHYEKSYLELSDDALDEACDYLNGKWAEGDSARPAAKLLEEAAAALNQVEWPKSVRRTEDFVVYAVGVEGSGLRRSLKAGLSPEKAARLKAEGLL